jgi:hypothetical protein
VEAVPAGQALPVVGTIAPRPAVSLAEGFCATALDARGQARYLSGVTPEVTYCMIADGDCVFRGVVPRWRAFLGSRSTLKVLDGARAFENSDVYHAPEVANAAPDPDMSNAYLAGLLLAFAIHGRHPFAQFDDLGRNQIELTASDVLLPLSAPFAVERLLRAVLVADPARRIGLDELNAELRRLATAGL